MTAYLALPLALLLSVPVFAQDQPLARYGSGGAEVQLRRDGSFTVTDQGAPLVTDAKLMIFGPSWESAVQRDATVTNPTATQTGAQLSGRMVEKASGKPWEYTQRVTVQGEALRFEYELHPLDTMRVNEVSLVLDLPLERFQDRQLFLYPRLQMAFPAKLPANYHFVSGRTSAYVFDAGSPSQLSLSLDRPRTCNVQDTRQWKGSSYQAFVKILESARDVTPADRFTLAFTLTPRDPKTWVVPTMNLTSDQPLKLAVKSVDPAQATQGNLTTVHLDLQGTWKTPFWQEEVALDATITGPDGKTFTVPGFYTQDYLREDVSEAANQRAELLTPQGNPEWQVRFLPQLAGNYQVALRAKDRSGQVTADTQVIVTPGKPRPFLRVSKSHPHYFEFESGEPYVANGLNVCWYRSDPGTFDYDDWFSRLAENGGNYARIWMPNWAFGYEWGKPGSYKLDRAWQFDYVLQLAQEKGIYLKLCMEAFRTFDADNPYAKANGGPCDKVLDVFTNEQARQMWRNRLRYAVARWGWSPNLMAFEFWNEINCVQGYEEEPVQEWARDMAHYLRSIDANRHLIVNSLGSFVFEPDLWAMPEMEFAQMHGYWHPSWKSTEFGKDMAQMMVDHVAMVRTFGKPCFFAEFGLVNETWGGSPRMKDDPEGVNLHNGMWGALMAGAAGPAHLWWWDNYVAPQNLWFHYRGVANLVQGVGFNTESFVPIAPQGQPEALRVLGLRGKTTTLLWAQNKAHTWWNVAEKHEIAPVENAQVTLEAPAGFAGTTCRVQLWDTWSGKLIADRSLPVTDGRATLDLGRVERDLAARVLW